MLEAGAIKQMGVNFGESAGGGAVYTQGGDHVVQSSETTGFVFNL